LVFTYSVYKSHFFLQHLVHNSEAPNAQIHKPKIRPHRRENEEIETFRCTDDQNIVSNLCGEESASSDSDENSSDSSLISEESVILPDNTDNITDEPDSSVTEDSINDDKPNQENQGLTVLYTNADSLLGKRDLLKCKIEDLKPDIIAITETLPKNLSKSSLNPQQEYGIEGFNMFMGSQNKRGVIIYTANHLQVSKEDELTESEHEEQVWCNIRTKTGDLIFGNIYHSPSSTQENHAKLRTLIDDSCSKGSRNVIIVGDFNMPSIDWEAWNGKSQRDTMFIDTLQDQYLSQHVEEPTRYRFGQNPSLVDLVISSEEDLVSELKHLDPIGKSDHLCIIFRIEIEPEVVNKNQQKYQMDKGDFAAINQMMKNINWEDKTAKLNTEMTWTLFKEKYDTAVETCIPKYTVKPNKWRRPLWMNGDAIKRTKKKYWSWKRYMNTGREEDYNRYCRKRNTAQIFNNQLRKNFEKMIAREAKTKPKAFWRYVKSKTRTRESLSPLEKQDGQLTQNDEEKAELLNTYFGSVFTRENKDSSPHLENRHFEHQLDNMQITEADVENLLAKMKPDKSPGPDQIHPRVLRECCSTMAKPLTIIFRKSLGEGQVPMSWKDAKVTPIYKKGKKKQPCNYRPVSLTSVVCKIMEKMIRKQIMGHLDRNNLLTDAQYGFRNRRSTVLQLLKVLDHWTELLDEGKCLDVLYLDFSKAFDTVPHKRLLHKLEAYGIKGNMLNWITDFLTARRQQVSVNGILSSWI
jgi:endonuclease/exonuclease/phosphatase family metal-dependent hydrolase